MKGAQKKLILISVAAFAVVVLLFVPGRKFYLHLKYPYHSAMASQLSVSFDELEKYAGARNELVERHLGMMVEASRENWDKLAELTRSRDDLSLSCTYFYNLANAMTGRLGERLLSRPQHFGYGLFIPVGEKTSVPDLLASGEVWYQLGEMTMAEHHTILGMIYSPAHQGPRFYRRMAEICLINGDEGAARKYISLLGDTLDGRWKEKRQYVQRGDIVHIPSDVRPVLKGLLKSNPDNTPAYEYLLCHDLLTKNIPCFVEDYIPGRKVCKLYQEGALVALAGAGDVSEDKRAAMGISDEVYDNFNRYNESFNAAGGNPDMLTAAFGRTYWYYFHFAGMNENAERK